MVSAVDGLGGLLDGPRAHDAFLLRAVMNPPWSIRVQDEAPLTLVAMVRGDAWIVLDDASEPRPVGAGDVVILRGPDPYVFADDPLTAPQIVIHPGQHCTTPDGTSLEDEMNLGVRTWGNDANGRVMMLIGTYQLEGEVSGRLLRALPTVLVLERDTWDAPFIPLLADEIVKDDPGQELVLDRLLDVLLIAALRAWFARDDGAPAWYRAQSDPVVGPALTLLHNNPAHRWTVGELARQAGVSRAAFARRFNDVVGEPPMTFLTNWRLALAADLLREPDATVGSVAHEVGYGSAFALSAAFKRAWGVSPRDYRLTVAS
jgi:AraC-like DNA-binding protein